MTSMKARYLFPLGGAVLVIAAALVARLAGRPEPEHAPREGSAVAVATQPVRTDEIAETVEIGGHVRARSVATVMSRVVGEVRAVRVAPGDRVRMGAPLVVLDSRELAAGAARMTASLEAARHGVALAQAEHRAAQAGLALAQATHRRIADLHGRKSATPHELDQAVAALRAAEASLTSGAAREAEADAQVVAATAGAEAARVAVSYTVLSAPFDGVVTQKLVDVGNTAAPGMPLVTVEDVGGFRLEVFVDESRIGFVSIGQAVDVALDGVPGSSIKGHVSEVARAVDPGLHAFLVKVELPEQPLLRSGMFGRVRLTGPTRRAVVVPAASLVRNGQLVSVFVVSEGRARMRLVTPAQSDGDRVEIRAGLDEGERVVVAPPPGLVDGSPVTERT